MFFTSRSTGYRQSDRSDGKQTFKCKRHYLGGVIVEDSVQSQGFATIRFQGDYARIYVSPYQMSVKPVNTWAFVIGHELGHHILGTAGSPKAESDADVQGAKMAVKASYDVKAYIRALYSDANSWSLSHGCWHSRAKALEEIYGSTGKWEDLHKDHPRGDGPFPPNVNSGQKIRIYCQHTSLCHHPIACIHRDFCRHIVWNGFAFVALHPFDPQHQFDLLHAFDFLHPFDEIMIR